MSHDQVCIYNNIVRARHAVPLWHANYRGQPVPWLDTIYPEKYTLTTLGEANCLRVSEYSGRPFEPELANTSEGKEI